MKKTIIFALVLFVISSFLIGQTTYAYDEEFEVVKAKNETVQEEDNNVQNPLFLVPSEDSIVYEKAVQAIENDLAFRNTSVLDELIKQRNMYENMLLSADEEEIRTIQSLINTLTELIGDYQIYYLNDYSDNIMPMGGFHLFYSPIVESAIAYFSIRGYNLSAELLIHARDNNVLDSYYTPTNRSRIESSSVYTNIIDGSSLSGSSAFPNSGSTNDIDLYYSIHAFRYFKSNSSNTVVITDRYDFEGTAWTSFGGVAIDLIYHAQQAGVLVPYLMELDFTTSKPSSNPPVESFMVSSSTRYLEKIPVLGKGEYQEYLVTFVTGGNKIIQTFGPKDAYLYLYDSNGNLLQSNDDGGHELNAWIRLDAAANTQYRIRVKFYSTSRYGRVKLGITPANMGSSQPQQMNGWGSIFITNMANSLHFYTWINLNGTHLHRITINETRNYIFETDKYDDHPYIDMYLYLIDPSSMRTYWYNDDGGTGYRQSKITAYLASGKTYLIIMSTYNITTQSGHFLLRVTKQ